MRGRVLRWEDRVQRAVGRGLLRLGRPLVVRVFPGYGTEGWVRVLGRVVVEGVQPASPVSGPVSTRQALRTNLGQFVTTEVPAAKVRVECEGRVWEVTADREGYVDAVLDQPLDAGQHAVTMTPLDPTGAPCSGWALVHRQDAPVVVVSDIDDTLIDSGIAKGVLATLTTALLRDSATRVPLEGAPRLYRALAASAEGDEGGGARPFFYLSTSPWNLADFLSTFLERHGFPRGALLLTDWGPGNAGLLRIGAREHKLDALRRLAHELPHARFVLLGDSGQQDPAIYTEFALDDPGRVAAVYIRQAHGPVDRVRAMLDQSGQTLAEVGVPFLVADTSEAMLLHAQQHGLASA